MKYAVIAKPEIVDGQSCRVFTLDAEGVVPAAHRVAGALGIATTPELMQHFVVMPLSSMPAGWDGNDPTYRILTTDLDVSCAPGF
jgi:hypothetical protein